MQPSIGRLASAVVLGLTIALASAGVADAESVMKICADQWKQAKAGGATNGETWQQFLAQCRAQQSGAATAPAATPAATQAPAAAAGKTAKECNAEYAANKGAIKAGGQTKRDFVAACRSGTETIPTAAAAPAPAPAPIAPPPAPANYQPAAPAPAPIAPRPQVGATGAGGFASDAQAKARCPSDTVVWVNTKSGVYNFAGTHNNGTTEHGAYKCEADALAAGDRAAKNEKHP
jgi:hypothetical protein